METYRERKQSVYRVYARSFDDDRCPMLGDQALPTCLTFVADALNGIGAALPLRQRSFRAVPACRPPADGRLACLSPVRANDPDHPRPWT
jgi:hypothetical protein